MKKKIILVITITIILILSVLGIYFWMYNGDDNNLTSADKQWIEKNKNAMIDISLINNIPAFNYNGEGVLLDFVEKLSDDTGLDFNKLSYNLGGDAETSLGLVLVDEVEDKDLLVYKDSYVIITKSSTKYNNLDEIENMTVGVVKDDMDKAKEYLKANSEIAYKEYSNYDTLISAIKANNSQIDGIIIPKLTNLKEIVENTDFHIAYNISDMYKSLVLRLGDNKKLNEIISKYFKSWYKNNYKISFDEHFTAEYFNFKNVKEEEKIDFKTGKTYTYGFVSYVPYDGVVNKKLQGINQEIIKDFISLTNVQIKWKEYKNIDKLLKDFNNGKIDFFLDIAESSEYSIDVVTSNSKFNDKIVVIDKYNNHNVIKSLASLKNKNVLTIKNSKIKESLEEYGIDAKTYDNVKKMLHSKKDSDILVIDYLTYEIYKDKQFKNYQIKYSYDLNNNYRYVFNNKDNNKVFNDYFTFYLEYIDFNEYKSLVNSTTFHEKVVVKIGPYVAIVALIVIILGLVNSIYKRFSKKEKIVNISKEEKIKYIDALTSLKNRNYLNDSIKKWDDSEVYPQSIVVIDLNNVAYINDNYGHEEGDNIIKEAAGILINSQIENTEIMRTNGNEFLIYMVNYDEKQVVTYIRKLNKDFKELSHGFGAAIGYSMITDPIKTIDDAINEATLAMKNNKEEIQN